MKGKSQIISIIIAVGLLLIWVGERIVDRGSSELVASGLGVALIVIALALRLMRIGQAKGDDFKHVERWLALLHGGAAASVALYFLQSDAFAKVAGHTLETDWPKLAGVISVLWPVLLVCSLAPTLLVELAYAAMARAPKLETARVREAMLSGLGLAFALTFAFALQYVVTERDVKRDFSYVRVATPGEATHKLVQSFTEKTEVALFYPPASDVGELVVAYFDDLKQAAPLLEISSYDYALDPIKAKELGVTGNGTVVVKKGTRKESFFTGTEVEKARTQLSSLDQEIQKRFLQVGKTRRPVYLTSGHGERTQDALGGADQRGTVELLHKVLEQQNFDVKVLSSAEGLGTEVPSDAAAVFVVGPQRAFATSEAETLAAYEKRGGKLFIALDPEHGLAFDELMKPLGLTFTPQLLANERANAQINHAPSDRINIATQSYSSHPSVTSLSRRQDPLLLMGAGSLDELPAHEAGLSVDFAVRALPDTWNDLNGNYKPDSPPEVRKAYGLMAAITRRGTSTKIEDELRVLVLSDSDAMTDFALNNVQGNVLMVVDGTKWLLGDESLQGVTNSEQDVPLTRTKEQDNLWFYGTTVLAPLAVVGVGLLARRRTKKKEVA